MAIANALQLEAARRRAVPTRCNSSPVPSLKSLSLYVAVLERFSCWYVTLRCDLELWPRDLDLWPLTLNICSRPALPRSNSVRNFSEIGQSAAELLQFELWPYDIEHLSRVALCSGIVCIKFTLSQAISFCHNTVATSKYRLEVAVVEGGGSLWPNISGRP